MASNLEKTAATLTQKISDHPKLANVSHIGISIQKKGSFFKPKKVIQILGRVNRQADLDVIDAIIEEEVEGIEVVKELRIENRS